MNRVIISGRLGADPIALGEKGCRIDIAATETWGSKEHVEWIPVRVWGTLAKEVLGNLKKGRFITVEGRYQTDKWDKDGVIQYSSCVRAERIEFGPKPSPSQGVHSIPPEDILSKEEHEKLKADIPF